MSRGRRVLVLGVGLRPGTPPAALRDAVSAVLAGLTGPAGPARPADVAVLATLDARAEHPAVRALASALGVPVRGFPAAALAVAAGGAGSAVVAAAVGTPAVAEPAARLAAPPGSRLIVPRQVLGATTVAVAGPADTQWCWSPGLHLPATTVPDATAGRRGADRRS